MQERERERELRVLRAFESFLEDFWRNNEKLQNLTKNFLPPSFSRRGSSRRRRRHQHDAIITRTRV